jgi:hypothetical protein
MSADNCVDDGTSSGNGEGYCPEFKQVSEKKWKKRYGCVTTRGVSILQDPCPIIGRRDSIFVSWDELDNFEYNPFERLIGSEWRAWLRQQTPIDEWCDHGEEDHEKRLEELWKEYRYSLRSFSFKQIKDIVESVREKASANCQGL